MDAWEDEEEEEAFEEFYEEEEPEEGYGHILQPSTCPSTTMSSLLIEYVSSCQRGGMEAESGDGLGWRGG